MIRITANRYRPRKSIDPPPKIEHENPLELRIKSNDFTLSCCQFEFRVSEFEMTLMRISEQHNNQWIKVIKMNQPLFRMPTWANDDKKWTEKNDKKLYFVANNWTTNNNNIFHNSVIYTRARSCVCHQELTENNSFWFAHRERWWNTKSRPKPPNNQPSERRDKTILSYGAAIAIKFQMKFTCTHNILVHTHIRAHCVTLCRAMYRYTPKWRQQQKSNKTKRISGNN